MSNEEFDKEVELINNIVKRAIWCGCMMENSSDYVETSTLKAIREWLDFRGISDIYEANVPKNGIDFIKRKEN